MPEGLGIYLHYDLLTSGELRDLRSLRDERSFYWSNIPRGHGLLVFYFCRANDPPQIKISYEKSILTKTFGLMRVVPMP